MLWERVCFSFRFAQNLFDEFFDDLGGSFVLTPELAKTSHLFAGGIATTKSHIRERIQPECLEDYREIAQVTKRVRRGGIDFY